MQAGLVVDGIMGPNTRAAITAFQRSGRVGRRRHRRSDHPGRLAAPAHRPLPSRSGSHPQPSLVHRRDLRRPGGRQLVDPLLGVGVDRTAGGAGSTAAGALRNTARDYALRNAASRRALAPAPAAIPNTRPRQSRMGRSTSANTPSSASSWPAVRSGPASSTTCPTIASTSRRTVIDPGPAQDPP